jgi:hypothetical protein
LQVSHKGMCVSDKIDLIYDMIKTERDESSEFRKEVRETNRKVEEKLTKIEIETNDRLSKIEALDQVQNQQLAEHIRRTEILEDLHRDNEKRIQVLELPSVTLTMLGSWIGWVSAVGGAIYGILKLTGLL